MTRKQALRHVKTLSECRNKLKEKKIFGQTKYASVINQQMNFALRTLTKKIFNIKHQHLNNFKLPVYQIDFLLRSN